MDLEYLEKSTVKFNILDTKANVYQYIGYVATTSYSKYRLREGYGMGTIHYMYTKTIHTILFGDYGLIYGTYLGGNGSDVCSDIKIDSNGYAYICGFTTSTDFPVEGYDNGWVKDGYNSFFIKIDPSKEKRKSLLGGKFLRKNISDFALAMAIDNNLNLYITGYSHSISKSMEKREGNFYEEAAIGMI